MTDWSNLPPANQAWCEYLTANGIDPVRVSVTDHPVVVGLDGDRQIQVWEFVLDENGKRQFVPDEGFLKEYKTYPEKVPPVAVLPRMG